MLGGDGDDAAAGRALGGGEAGGALDGDVVGLGGAGGEDDLPRVRADQGGEFGAGVADRLFGVVAQGVLGAVGVAEALGEEGQHGRDDAGVARGGGLVVEVDHAASGVVGGCVRVAPLPPPSLEGRGSLANRLAMVR